MTEHEWTTNEKMEAILEVLPKAYLRFYPDIEMWAVDWGEEVCEAGAIATTRAAVNTDTSSAVSTAWLTLTEHPFVRRYDSRRGRNTVEWKGRFWSIKPAPKQVEAVVKTCQNCKREKADCTWDDEGAVCNDWKPKRGK